jgi:predicted metal-dependent enzyme (double-stranded beta helix superfamily)
LGQKILSAFFTECQTQIEKNAELADTVHAIAPHMKRLVEHAETFLQPQHYQSDPNHYARNLVYDDQNSGLSLYTLVWEPGQWTPVHDHGTWGVVGIIDGQLEEQGYMRNDPDQSFERHRY